MKFCYLVGMYYQLYSHWGRQLGLSTLKTAMPCVRAAPRPGTSFREVVPKVGFLDQQGQHPLRTLLKGKLDAHY